MANPSPDAVAAIRAFVADWTQSPATILAALNTPSVANPTPQATVAAPFTALDLLGAIDPARRPAVKLLLPAIRPDLDAQDARAIVGWAAALVLTGDLLSADVDAITAVVSATQADPSYASRIGWAAANLGRPVDAADVAEARPTAS